MRLINADALIAEMHNVILEDGEDRRTFYEVIERQPTIEPQRKTGKWIWKIWSKYQCSECGHVTDVDECMEEPMYNYCPYCGADMRGEDDDIPIEYFESGGK